MALLKERLKRASKNNTMPVVAVPIATVQPTIKMLSPLQQIPNTDETIDDDFNIDNENNEYNATFNVSQGYNHEESSPQMNVNELSRFLRFSII